MSSRAERFAQAVRLGLEKRDAERGTVAARGSSQQEDTLHFENTSSVPQGVEAVESVARGSTSDAIAGPSKNANTTEEILNAAATAPSRRGAADDVSGKLARPSQKRATMAVGDGDNAVAGAFARTRQMSYVSMFDDDGIMAVHRAATDVRPVSSASGSVVARRVDYVAIGGVSDEDCIDSTEGGVQRGAGRREQGASGAGSSAAGPSSSLEEAYRVGTALLNDGQDNDVTAVPVSVPIESAVGGMELDSKTASDEGEKGVGEPAKKRRKKVKEKREAKYRNAPSKAALDRLERSAGHRLFLVDKSIEEGQIRCAVMGTNGNVYKCCIDLTPSCNCQDFSKRRETSQHGPCKHLIFIFMRVLKLDHEDPRWWQKCLVPSELEGLLSTAQGSVSPESGVLAEEAVLVEYRKSSSQELDETGRRPLEGECTVCYEDLVPTNRNTQSGNETTFCKKCGNNFHSACLDTWFRAQANRTCPLCRASMANDGDKTNGDSTAYMNLSQHSSVHERQLTLAELYADTHMYIGRGGRGHGRGHGRRSISHSRGRRLGRG